MLEQKTLSLVFDLIKVRNRHHQGERQVFEQMNIVELRLRKSLDLGREGFSVDLVFELEVEVVDLVRDHMR